MLWIIINIIVVISFLVLMAYDRNTPAFLAGVGVLGWIFAYVVK